MVVDALNGLDGELKGKYYPLGKMTEEEQNRLIDVSIDNYYAMIQSYCSD